MSLFVYSVLSNCMGDHVSFMRVGSHLFLIYKAKDKTRWHSRIHSLIAQFLLSLKSWNTWIFFYHSNTWNLFNWFRLLFWFTFALNFLSVCTDLWSQCQSGQSFSVYNTCPHHIVNVQYCVFFLLLNTYALPSCCHVCYEVSLLI